MININARNWSNMIFTAHKDVCIKIILREFREYSEAHNLIAQSSPTTAVAGSSVILLYSII